MSKWSWLVIFVLIFCLGAFLRFYQLGQIPVSLYWDETAMLVDARAVAETGRDMHGNSWFQAIFPSYGDYKLPVYIWLASFSVKLFGASEWALRLPSAIAGLLTIITAALIARELFPAEKKRPSGWLMSAVALAVAAAPWSVMFSRTGFEGHVGQLLLALSVLTALKMKRGWQWGLAAALLGGLATYTYFSIRFVWPAVFLAAGCLFSGKKPKLQWAISIILPLVLYGLILVPMYRSPLYAASNQFRLSTTSLLNMADWPVVSNEYKLQAGNTIFDKAVYHPYVLMGRELAKNYSDNLSAQFLFFTGDPNLRHGTGRHGLFLEIFLLPFLYGWYRLFPKYWKQGTLLLIWWLAALLPASVPETTPHALRTLNALVPLAIVIGWGCWAGWQAVWESRWPWFLKIPVLGGAVLIFLASAFDFASYYFLQYPAASSRDWQDGYKAVAHEAWTQKDEMDVVWVEPFDSRFYLWLLAYEVPVSEYPDISFENYMPSAIENIRFRWFDWEKLPTLSEKTVLLAKKDFIDWNLETVPRLPAWYKTFTRSDGAAEFAGVYFEKVP